MVVQPPVIAGDTARSLIACWNSADWPLMSVKPDAAGSSVEAERAIEEDRHLRARHAAFGQKLASPQPVVMPSSARKTMSSTKLSVVLPRSPK